MELRRTLADLVSANTHGIDASSNPMDGIKVEKKWLAVEPPATARTKLT
jgi:hypothetical protein